MHEIPALLALARHCTRRHGETHVLWPIDQFEDGGGSLDLGFRLSDGVLVALLGGEVLVLFAGFYAKDSCVAAWSVCVALAEGTEEFGEHFMWCLGDVSGVIGLLIFFLSGELWAKNCSNSSRIW